MSCRRPSPPHEDQYDYITDPPAAFDQYEDLDSALQDIADYTPRNPVSAHLRPARPTPMSLGWAAQPSLYTLYTWVADGGVDEPHWKLGSRLRPTLQTPDRVYPDPVEAFEHAFLGTPTNTTAEPTVPYSQPASAPVSYTVLYPQPAREAPNWHPESTLPSSQNISGPSIWNLQPAHPARGSINSTEANVLPPQTSASDPQTPRKTSKDSSGRPAKKYPHQSKSYERPGCHVCSKTFSRSSDRDRHLKTHRNTEDIPANEYYVCHGYENCDYKTLRKSGLKEHLAGYHKEDLPTGSIKDDEWWGSRNIFETWWRCAECLKRVYIKKSGWKCLPCHTPCNSVRVMKRLAKFPHTAFKEPQAETSVPTTGDGDPLRTVADLAEQAATSSQFSATLSITQNYQAAATESLTTNPPPALAPVATTSTLPNQSQNNILLREANDYEIMQTGYWDEADEEWLRAVNDCKVVTQTRFQDDTGEEWYIFDDSYDSSIHTKASEWSAAQITPDGGNTEPWFTYSDPTGTRHRTGTFDIKGKKKR
ncbi:hypothetical protein BKA65DRAFT_480693 [Rhexocercosporidium sp. MPI-PUGE-AT-0058]|nr:hypothetical protein BKA65DRAFT_480693 [Rhexocercosporidium sp. MPI-PUGE-AT-0058]